MQLTQEEVKEHIRQMSDEDWDRGKPQHPLENPEDFISWAAFFFMHGVAYGLAEVSDECDAVLHLIYHPDPAPIIGDWLAKDEKLTALGLLKEPDERTSHISSWQTSFGRAVFRKYQKITGTLYEA